MMALSADVNDFDATFTRENSIFNHPSATLEVRDKMRN